MHRVNGGDRDRDRVPLKPICQQGATCPLRVNMYIYSGLYFFSLRNRLLRDEEKTETLEKTENSCATFTYEIEHTRYQKNNFLAQPLQVHLFCCSYQILFCSDSL